MAAVGTEGETLVRPAPGTPRSFYPERPRTGRPCHLIAQDALILAQRDPGALNGTLDLVTEVGSGGPIIIAEVLVEGVLIQEVSVDKGAEERLKDTASPWSSESPLADVCWE